MRLQDKVAIVTGGASGIGEFTVREMLKQGAKVVIADFDDAGGQKLADELGEGVSFIHVDVSNEEQVEAMVKHSVDTFGKVDILFSNAGIGSTGSTHELSLEDWNKTISVNLSGVFLCAKYALIEMVKQGSGSIVNCASILGHVGQAATASYTAAKGGVVNMTRALAVEYASQGIRVNAVCPGYINTPLLDQLDDATRKHLVSLHPLGRLGESQEVANAVVFLASDEASFVTGANLLVDGGYTAQ
ncbi:SDR family NAD(P)-dependent oxidoreductase [Paenisporosarcina macmurdoensis]|uniref:SDR family NAD(P)-dependent oxidoreductase n=1 Tax=Paenisporosarcina macmurdoensis TaxID=212659 RepID=A0ABW1L6T7_9BACL